MNSLYTLIEETLKLSPEFKTKMSYWIHTRNRVPETKWIISQLVKVHGESKVLKKLKGSGK